MPDHKEIRLRLDQKVCEAVGFIRINRRLPDNATAIRDAVAAYQLLVKEERRGCRVLIEGPDGTQREVRLSGRSI